MIGTTAITRGESAPGVIRGFAPYRLGGGDEAVAFIHGISGSPAHFREMAETFAEAGYTARGILLPGHGTKAKHLRRVTWMDWYDHCAQEIRTLQQTHRAVHVVGYSIGAALAIELATGEGSLGRLALLSVPLNPRQSATLMRIGFGLHAAVFPRLHGNPPRMMDDTGREFYYVYKTVPSTIYKTMLDLVTETKRTVLRLQNPTLIVQSRADRAVGALSGPWTYDRIPATEKQLLMLPDSDHAVMLDRVRHCVFAAVLRFFRRKTVAAARREETAYAMA